MSKGSDGALGGEAFLEELEATRDRLSPRRFPELLRDLLEHGPPAESFDVGV